MKEKTGNKVTFVLLLYRYNVEPSLNGHWVIAPNQVFILFFTWLRDLDKKKKFMGSQPDIDGQWEIYRVLIPVL